jgi:hypothetical protein
MRYMRICPKDIEDLNAGLERANDPSDPILDWEEVRRGLLDQD